MDKYQEVYFKNLFPNQIAVLYSTDLSKIYQSLKIEKNTLSLLQDEDINIEKYILLFDLGKYINNVIISFSNDKKNWSEIEVKNFKRNDSKFIAKALPIDFKDPIKFIKIADKNEFIEPVIFNLVYVEADKEKYYAKIAQAKKDKMLKTAQISHATGADLVNIYFQPCCDEYAKTTIILYNKDQQLMAKYKVEEDVFFKSISGLAYGTYYYELIQYDTNGIDLIKTNKIAFTIKAASNGSKPIVCNH